MKDHRPQWKRDVHELYERYYAARKRRKSRERCIRCGHMAVLGVRKPGLGLCRRCRKEERRDGQN